MRFLIFITFMITYSVVAFRFRRINQFRNGPIARARSKNTETSKSNQGKILVIVESPAKAKTIQKFLPDEYIVDYCAGHIRNLPSSGSILPDEYKKKVISKELNLRANYLGIDVYDNFKPFYVTASGKDDRLQKLINQAKKCSMILLATDEDREGEAISWHLLECLKPTVPHKRAVFREITKNAILDSFNNPREIDMNLVQSQETRRILDRLAGFTLSPVLWRYVARGLSAGRVQSCGLHLITQKEKKRWDFKESSFYSIQASFSNTTDYELNKEDAYVIHSSLYSINGRRIALERDFDGATGLLKESPKAKVTNKPIILNEDDARLAINCIGKASARKEKEHNGVITDIEESTYKKQAPVPFITSTLQQESSRQLGLSPFVTMKIAQELYESGYITYMRTDSPKLSALALEVSKRTVETIFGDEFVYQDTDSTKKGSAKRDKKVTVPINAQEAHEAIRPVEVNGKYLSPKETGLEGKDLELYRLIFRRTLASVMSASIAESKTFIIDGNIVETGSKKKLKSKGSNGEALNDIETMIFRSSITVPKFPGYTAVWDLDDDLKYRPSKRPPFPDFQVGQHLWLCNAEDDDVQIEESDEDAVDEEETVNKNNETTRSLVQSTGLKAISHKTRPPTRFSEASFIKELENVGVGRPSTYAKIIQILSNRGYIFIDKKAVIPTVKGMVVSNLLEKHFSDFINPTFTASMEKALDGVADGTIDKVDFLKRFYLGEKNNENDSEPVQGSGFLHTVVHKMKSGEMNHIDCRTLTIPFLEDLGVIYLVYEGASLIEKSSTDSDSATKAAQMNRWVLPQRMQLDFRTITRDAIIELKSQHLPNKGQLLGIDPTHNKTVYLRSGKFGKYLVVGDDDDKDRMSYSVPNWLDSTVPFEKILEFTTLPKAIFTHPDIGLPIIASVIAKKLCISVENYPIRVDVSDGILVSDITLEMAVDLLGDPSAILASQKLLGIVDGKHVFVKQGKYGYYFEMDDQICGIRKLDFQTVTLDDALDALRTRGKSRKSALRNSKEKSKGKSKAKPKLKSKIRRSSTKKTALKRKRSLTGYQFYASEVMKTGKTLSQAAAGWRDMNDEEKMKYKEQAVMTSSSFGEK